MSNSARAFIFSIRSYCVLRSALRILPIDLPSSELWHTGTVRSSIVLPGISCCHGALVTSVVEPTFFRAAPASDGLSPGGA